MYDFGKAFLYVPVSFFVLGVAEQAAFWIKHPCVLIDSLLASVL